MPAKNARLVNGLLNASFILQNLPEDLVLPPLPPIADPALERTALTHVSFHGIKRRDDDFDLEQAEEILDYEKLEFVGDGILGGLVTPLCHDLYPNLRQGASTLLKTGMVANTTLALIADAYKLPQKLKTSPDAFYAAPSSIKVKASVFESWVAGVYYSQLAEIIKRRSNQEPHIEAPEDGSVQDSVEVVFKESPENSPKVSHPDTPPVDETEADMDAVEDECGSGSDSDDPITYVSRLFRPMREMSSSSRESVSTTASQIPDVPTIPDAYHIAQGEAIAFLNAWIRPLFTPIAHYTMHCIQEYKVQLTKEQTRAPLEQGEQEGDDARAVGAKSALSTYTSKKFHSLPVYTYDRASGGFWRAKCAVVDDQGNSLEAIAVRANQRQASMVAAYRICRQLKFVK